MRRIPGLVLAAGLLFLPASQADAQVVFSYGSPYGYNGYYGGYGMGFGMPWGATSYNSAYSVYTAPGTSYFATGYAAPYLGFTPYGYSAFGYPGYGYFGYGIPGYGFAPYSGRNYGYASTGLYMGLPRPFGGLIRVPR